MFLLIKKASGYGYLQIVENKRMGGKTRQRVIGTIGRRDELEGHGQIDQLLRSLAKYSVRSRAEGCCGKVFAAMGVAFPSTLRAA